MFEVDTAKVASTTRRAAIKYSDKKRVERFKEYATGVFTKRDLDGALTALIGDLALDTALRSPGNHLDHSRTREHSREKRTKKNAP